jgi:hypothetical protein
MASFPWYRISRERLDFERSVLGSLPYFRAENQYFDFLKRLIVIGTLTYSRPRSGRVESFRIRLEYPDRFPKHAQRVYDHEKVFQPGNEGHLPGYRLCLTLPERGEFSTGTEKLTEEVLGAALIWFDKRLIFERNRCKWPGPDERHGALAKIDLYIQRAGLSDNQDVVGWADALCRSAAKGGRYFEIDVYSPCPCGSGRKFKFCHFNELRPLIKLVQELSVSALPIMDPQSRDAAGTI